MPLNFGTYNSTVTGKIKKQIYLTSYCIMIQHLIEIATNQLPGMIGIHCQV